MSEPELDRELAAKLRAAAKHEPYAVLDEAARARVVQRLREQPRARRVNWVNVGMAVAAAALLAVLLRPRAPACGLPTEAAFAGRTLDLAQFGRVVLAEDAEARLSRTDACELEITLARGSLAAALHDLKPARLTVRTPLGAVEVRGTTFAVTVADELEVVLLEGAVALREDETTTLLEPGHALTRRAHASSRVAAVQPQQERRLRELLAARSEPARVEVQEQAEARAPEAKQPEPAEHDEAPRASKRAQGATELLAAAERERRAGELGRARALYREAGQAAGADAEVALLRWTRLELEQDAQQALDVLARYRARYGRNLERARLAAEASFLEVQVLERLGRHAEANERARELVRRYPDSPHARAAAER